MEAITALATTFNYGEKPVRTTMIDDEAWFCLADACDVLDLKNPSHFAQSAWCDPDGLRLTYTVDNLDRRQEATFISEPNLYALIMRSRKPEALRFQRWITHEVLPAIRKTGRYEMHPQADQGQAEMMRELLVCARQAIELNSELVMRLYDKSQGAAPALAAKIEEPSFPLSYAAKAFGCTMDELKEFLVQDGWCVMEDGRLKLLDGEGHLCTVQDSFTSGSSGQTRTQSRVALTVTGIDCMYDFYQAWKNPGMPKPPRSKVQAVAVPEASAAPETTTRYTREFKLSCCRSIRYGNKSQKWVARKNKVGASTISKWWQAYLKKGDAAFG